MISLVLAFLAQIPGLASLAQRWAEARYNAQVAITTARIGGDVAKAQALIAAQIEAEHMRVAGLGVIAGSRALTLLTVGFAVPIIALAGKVILWDVIGGSIAGCASPAKGTSAEMLAHVRTAAEALEHARACATFETDPVRGQVSDIMSIVVMALFGSAGASKGIGAVIGMLRK